MGVEDDEAREHQGGQEPVDGHGDPSQREEDLQSPVDYNITLYAKLVARRKMDLLRKRIGRPRCRRAGKPG